MKKFLFFFLPSLLFSQNSYERSAFLAAEKGDLQSLKILIEKVNISPSIEKEGIPLIFNSKNINIAAYLSSRGAKSVDSKGRSMLMMASAKGDRRLFSYFIKKDKAFARDKEGWTPLHYVVAGKSSLSFAKKLILKGAVLDAYDKMKWTPLMYAAYRGNVKFVRFFLRQGANPLAKNNEGQTALDLAIENQEFAVHKKDYQKIIDSLSLR